MINDEQNDMGKFAEALLLLRKDLSQVSGEASVDEIALAHIYIYILIKKKSNQDSIRLKLKTDLIYYNVPFTN